MKRLSLVTCIMVLGLLLIYSGCQKKEEATKAAPEAKKEEAAKAGPMADGKAIWTYLKEIDYTKLPMWPGKEAFYPGKEPHGALLTTYVNETALNDIQGKKGTLSAGSIIVKENYMPDKKLAAVTVMYKVAGYNPEAADWFWAKYAPDGNIEAEGKATACISCHGQKKDNDYIMTGALK